MTDLMHDRVDIAEMRLGKMSDSGDLLLRFIFVPPPAPTAAQLPSATPALRLTPPQARHLLLLLGQGLGLPGSDIPSGPAKPTH